MYQWIFAMFVYVTSPYLDMRSEPSSNSEVVSQVYFSEEVRIKEEQQDWVKIENVVDQYVGWVKKEGLSSTSQPYDTMAKVNRLSAHLYPINDIIYGPYFTLFYDSRLKVLEATDPRWIKVALPNNHIVFVQRGDVSFENKILSKNEIVELSQKFLNIPYTWGGRTSFGYDCSGFVQMLYRQMGIFIPRDSKDQIKWEGFKEISFDELQKGDLIFFGLGEDKIRHVGLYLGDGQFIHATSQENQPYIRISPINWDANGRWTYKAARQLQSF